MFELIQKQDMRKMWIWLRGRNLCGQRETSSDANIAQVDYVPAWLGEFPIVCGLWRTLDNCLDFGQLVLMSRMTLRVEEI